MSISVRVPDDLYRKATAIAEAQHVSVEEVFAAAFAEQLAAWERLQLRAASGSRDRYLAVLNKAPDVEPEDFDKF